MELPNVSFAIDTAKVYYNPSVSENYVIATLNITEDMVGQDVMVVPDLEGIDWSQTNFEQPLYDTIVKGVYVDGELVECGVHLFQSSVPMLIYKFTSAKQYEVKVVYESLGISFMMYGLLGINTESESNLNTSYSLTSLDVSHLDTSKVQMFTNMFGWLTEQDNLDYIIGLKDLNVSNATDMSTMFMGCNKLKTLDLTSWDISNVTNMQMMFIYCNELTELRMGGNPCSLTNANGMFDVINTNGKFYYNSAYDYSLILAELPSTWEAVPCTLVDGVLIPN